MDVIENYYNEFYKELSNIDSKGNNFKKIEFILPKLEKNSIILDIGCGFGTVSDELIKKGHIVYGIEINDEAIKELNKKGFNVLKQDLNQPFNFENKFDLILLLDIIEHVFNPLALIENSIKYLKNDGYLIVSVPLYFDLFDRIRILFTGSIISYDNLVYGKNLFKRFKSYNYDHIRFFQRNDIFEMLELFGFNIERINYTPARILYPKILNFFMRIIINKFTVKLAPNLFAHRMILRIKKK